MPLFTDVAQNFKSRFILLNSPPLIDRGFGLIYDVERDITWLKNANYAQTVHRSPEGQMNWFEATGWVASLFCNRNPARSVISARAST